MSGGDEDLPARYRKTRRNRGPRCVSIIRWRYLGSREHQCYNRCERGQTRCVHCRNRTNSRFVEVIS